MQRRPQRTSLAVCALLLLAAACSSIKGERLTDPARNGGGRFYVEHQVRDPRRLDYQIADALQAHGLVVTQHRDEADYVVTYEDRWSWDMRTFLRDLKIEVRDRAGAVVGSGRSRQDSLAAMGKNYRDVIDRAVGAMFSEQPSVK